MKMFNDWIAESNTELDRIASMFADEVFSRMSVLYVLVEKFTKHKPIAKGFNREHKKQVEEWFMNYAQGKEIHGEKYTLDLKELSKDSFYTEQVLFKIHVRTNITSITIYIVSDGKKFIIGCFSDTPSVEYLKDLKNYIDKNFDPSLPFLEKHKGAIKMSKYDI